jgi:hypothetical protein
VQIYFYTLEMYYVWALAATSGDRTTSTASVDGRIHPELLTLNFTAPRAESRILENLESFGGPGFSPAVTRPSGSGFSR